MPHRLYADVAARARNRCEYCRAPEWVFNFEFEVDHIVATARGGTDDLSNLALACRSCNLRKGITERARDPVTGELVMLFDPHKHEWGEHFQLDVSRSRIEGLTAIGRATAARLGMNRAAAIGARRLWVSRLLLRFDQP